LIGCIVLAAGRGERMGGVAKAQLRLPDGRSFLEAVLAACAGLRTVIISSRAFEIDRSIINERPEDGMISSIRLGLDALEQAGCDAALVWPVDTPLVRPATVAAIAGASGKDRIVVPRGGGHPTSFGVSLWPELRVAATARDVVARDPARVVALDVDDPGVRADVDTPGDYDRIR
jgi:molybdenum cofactor cytidylyltransferase